MTEAPDIIDIHQYDERGVATGVSRSISVFDGCPPGWTFDAPPIVAEGKIAIRVGPDWVESDPLPAEVPPPAPVPQSITPLQARKALRALGLHAQVVAYVATLSDEAQEEWEYCTTVKRADSLVVTAARFLEMSEPQIDDFFRLGETFV
jgi:hypothetical protein